MKRTHPLLMSFGAVQDAKARFRAAWQSLRDNPLSPEQWREASEGTGLMVICQWGGRTMRWTQWVDDDETLEPVLAKRLFFLRHLLPIDMKLRAVCFIDPDLELYEIAEIGMGGPPQRPNIRARLPFCRNPNLTTEEQRRVEDANLKACWAALRLSLAREAAGLREPHPSGIPWPTLEQEGLEGHVLMLVPDEDDGQPYITSEDRDDFPDWIGDEALKLLPHDGKFRAIAFSDPDMDRWEVRTISKKVRFGPIQAGREPRDDPEPKLGLRLVKNLN